MSRVAPLSPGARIASLRIDRLLGQGSSGITYLVTDTALDTSFVLKEYAPAQWATRQSNSALQAPDGGAFAKGLQAFLDEGRMLARLDHPNVARVIDCFEANGTAYLKMPWYEGEALHTLLQRGGLLDRQEVLDLAAPLLDALAYLHERGIVHRDIKPANIFITRSGRPLLLDFGAAIPADSLPGSEGYAAPEQSKRDARIGPTADIYGLAATLYRCASGRIPPAADRREAAIAAGRKDPLPSLGGLLPAEFGDLADTIQAGLALDPRRRPPNATAWRREFLKQTAPRGTVDDEHREYLPAVLLAVFVIVMIGALGYLFWPDDTDGPTPDGETVQRDDEPLRSPQEEAQWRAALNADSAYGYQRFMQDYPNSIHNDQAMLHLERLDHQAWGRTRMEGSRPAVQAYLEQFPNGLHLADADILLNEIRLAEEAEQRRDEAERKLDEEAWDRARSARTIEAVDRYLADWPGGTHADEARRLRAQLQSSLDDRRAFEAAARLNTRDAYQAYIDAFPQGDRLAAALEAIDDLTLRPGKVFRDCAGCPDMMVLPAGSFWQGSDENSPLALKKETPRRMVSFQQPFAIGVFEVTFEQWDRCVAAGACSTNPDDNGWGRGRRPVMGVSWNDALEFTEWLSNETGQRYGLPSESQWEYAARAGEEGDWQGGSASMVCAYANIAGTESGFRWNHDACADTAAIQTLPVGSLEPNAFGLYDTIGNVAEWTMDCMNLSYLDAPADGSAWSRGICSSRMTRGGSWFTGTREIRLPSRFNLKNGDRNDFTGFRVVRAVQD